MTRTIRERPRLAAMTALGLGCLVALGLAFGLLLGGGDDADSERAAAAERSAERAALRRAQEQRAAAVELESELDSANSRAERFEQAAERQRLRAVGWRERALRAEQRSRALQRALTQAQAEPE